jgi:hypothetical protein
MNNAAAIRKCPTRHSVNATRSIRRKPLMKLWLDDVRIPPPPDPEHSDSHYSMWAHTAEEAWEFITAELVTFISFDHDLGQDKSTGYDLAKWIEESAFHYRIKRIKWQVHSQNPVGGTLIAEAMKKADRYWSRWEDGKTP